MGCSGSNTAQVNEAHLDTIKYTSVMRVLAARFSADEKIMVTGPLMMEFGENDTLPSVTNNIGYCSISKELSICQSSMRRPILSFDPNDWAPTIKSDVSTARIEISTMKQCVRMFNDITDGREGGDIVHETQWAIFCEGVGLLAYGKFLNDSEGTPVFDKHRYFDDIFILNGTIGAFSDCHIIDFAIPIGSRRHRVKCEAVKPIYSERPE